MNIFNTCQTENYASDYIDTKRQQAQSKDIKIVSRKKKTRRISTDLPFDLNVSLKSSINYKTNDINKPLDNDISGVIYIDPNNKLFNTNCPYKYLDYTFKPKVYSNIRPTIVITADGVSDGEITKVYPIELTFTTSEATTTFTETDISFNNGTISNFTASSITVYKATFEPTTDGHCTIDVFVDSFIGEGTGNYNIASTQFKLIYDKTPPVVVEFKLSDTALKIGDTATVTLKFSEVVAAFSSNDDITVVNGVLTTMTSSDNITWTGVYTPTDDIEDTTNVLTLATSYTDVAGNSPVSNSTTTNYTIDTAAPTISAVTQIATDTSDNTPSYVFTTNETGTVTTNIGAGILSGDTVTSTGNHTITFNILSDATYTGKTITLTDAAGNESSLTLDAFTVDTTAPTISAVTQIATDTSDNTPSYVFTTNETGTVTTNIGAGILSGDTVTSTGNHTITFNILSDATYTGKTITLTDAAGNESSLTLDAFTVDTTAPTVSSFTMSNTALNVGSTSTVTIVFSEAVTNFDKSNITAPNGSLGTMTNTACTNEWKGIFTPTPNTTAASNVLTLDTNWTDLAGNAGTTDATLNFTIDTTLPIFSSVSPSASSYVNTANIGYTLSEAIASGTVTYTSTGVITDSSSPYTINLAGTELNQGATTLTNTPALVSGAVYTITFNGVDAVGNNASQVEVVGVTFDTTVTYFPDTNFYNAIIHEIGSGAESSATNSLYNVSINTITSLDVNGETISDLTGIEGFTALEILKCYNNDLHSLDVSANTALTDLWCYDNSLDALDVTQNTALTDLLCYDNSLDALDVTQNTALTKLQCYRNSIATLGVSNNTQLWMLQCFGNLLTTLDVSQNTALILLNCNDNSIASLDVTQNTALLRLDCYNNLLTTLDVSQNTALTMLLAHGNSLTTLDVSQNTALTHLYCNENSLTTLDVTQNTALTDLWCYKNNFSGGGTSVITTAFTNTFDGTFDADPQNVGVTVTGNFCKVADEAAKTHFDDSYNTSIPTNANYYF
jgi:hypothetical protein